MYFNKINIQENITAFRNVGQRRKEQWRMVVNNLQDNLTNDVTKCTRDVTYGDTSMTSSTKRQNVSVSQTRTFDDVWVNRNLLRPPSPSCSDTHAHTLLQRQRARQVQREQVLSAVEDDISSVYYHLQRSEPNDNGRCQESTHDVRGINGQQYTYDVRGIKCQESTYDVRGIKREECTYDVTGINCQESKHDVGEIKRLMTNSASEQLTGRLKCLPGDCDQPWLHPDVHPTDQCSDNAAILDDHYCGRVNRNGTPICINNRAGDYRVVTWQRTPCCTGPLYGGRFNQQECYRPVGQTSLSGRGWNFSAPSSLDSPARLESFIL